MIKLLYKPFGLVLGMLSAIAAGKLSNMVWRTLSGQDTTPSAMDEHRHWGEIAAAAAVEGAVFAATKAAADRLGATTFAKATGTWPK
jgi:Protein of unknown function (DUF4235)